MLQKIVKETIWFASYSSEIVVRAILSISGIFVIWHFGGLPPASVELAIFIGILGSIWVLNPMLKLQGFGVYAD